MSSGNVTFEVFNRTAFSVQIVRQTAAEREVLAQLADETSSGKEHATLTLPSGTALVATNGTPSSFTLSASNLFLRSIQN